MFGSKLIQAGFLSENQLNQALQLQQSRSDKIGEILVDLGFVPESVVLRFLAAEFSTKYISSERLSRAKILPEVLRMLPLDYAERYNSLPVLFDPEKKQLSIVTSEPQNTTALREIHMHTQVREMRVYIALIPVVRAAIKKHYHGDMGAFPRYFEKQVHVSQEQEAQNNILTRPAQAPYPNPMQGMNPNFTPPVYPNQVQNLNPFVGNTGNLPSLGERLAQHSQGFSSQNFHPSMQQQMQQQTATPIWQPANLFSSAPPQAQQDSLMPTQIWLGAMHHLLQQMSLANPSGNQMLKATYPLFKRVLFASTEKEMSVDALELAFFLLGAASFAQPMSGLDWVLPNKEKINENIKRIEGIIASFPLPEETNQCLLQFYERVDGKGKPAQKQASEISFGAQLLSAVFSYGLLLLQEKSQDAAFKELQKHEKVIFDTNILNQIKKELEREQKANKSQIPHVLLIDSDATYIRQVEKECLKKGFWVEQVATLQQAESICLHQKISIVVLDVDFPFGEDGFHFVKRMKERSSLHFIFLSHRNQSEDVNKGIQLARDFLLKGTKIPTIVATIDKHIQQIEQTNVSSMDSLSKSHNEMKIIKGIAGSIEHMGVPELLQVLSQGRRSGKLVLEHPSSQIGEIMLKEGAIWDAQTEGKRGVEAFHFLISWQEGSFGLDPEFKVTERTIDDMLDSLLLEGLRLFDEEKRDNVKSEEIDIDALFGEDSDFF